jgi:hypothetical protein
MDREQGLEPRLVDPESTVLPLDDSRMAFCITAALCDSNAVAIVNTGLDMDGMSGSGPTGRARSVEGQGLEPRSREPKSRVLPLDGPSRTPARRTRMERQAGLEPALTCVEGRHVAVTSLPRGRQIPLSPVSVGGLEPPASRIRHGRSRQTELHQDGRGEWTRTTDLLHPEQARSPRCATPRFRGPDPHPATRTGNAPVISTLTG